MMQMGGFSAGETIAILTAAGAILTSLVTQVASARRARMLAEELIKSRIQDRLDREQVAKDLADTRQYELAQLKAKSDAQDAEVRRQLIAAEIQAGAQRQQLLRAVEQTRKAAAANLSVLQENTALTRHGAERADAAYREANHVNLKLEKLGLANQLKEREALQQADRIEDTVTATQETVGTIHEVLVNQTDEEQHT